MKNKLKANGYRIIKLALVCCALFIFSAMGLVTALSHANANATSQIAIDPPLPSPTDTPIPPTPTDTPIPPTPIPTTAPPTAVPTTVPPTAVPTAPPVVANPTPTPRKIPTATPVAKGSVSLTATAVASPTPGTGTPTATAKPGSSPTAVATQRASITATNHTAPPTNSSGGGGGPNIVLSVTIGLVLLLIAGGLGGLVMVRKRGIPALGLAGMGSGVQKAPSIPWTRNKKVEPVFDNGGAQSLQAGAFTTNGSPWLPLNNAQTTVPASTFGSISGLMPLNSQPLMPNVNQTYTPSALRPITTSLPAEYPHSRPLNTIQTSDMRPLSMDLLDFAAVLNQQDANTLRSTLQERTSGAFSGVATEMVRPSTEPIPVPTRNTPAPAGRLATEPLPTPQMPIPTLTPAPPATPAPEEPQLTTDAMLEAIMRQAQMGLYVLPDKQTPNRGDNNNH